MPTASVALSETRYTSLNPNRPEPPADPDTVKSGMDDALAWYSKFEDLPRKWRQS